MLAAEIVKEVRISRITNKILDYIFPPRCPMCDGLIRANEKGKICGACQLKIDCLDDKVCLKCGRKISETRDEYCKSCSRRHNAFTQGKILFEYQDDVRESLHKYKYANRREYALFYGRKAAERYGEWMHSIGIDLIVPVPMYKWKKWYRGYDQAELFAKALSKETGIAYERAVKRVKNTRPQSGMNESQRKNNLQNAFKINSDIVKYKRVLVVDDIYTTGSTVNEMAKGLLQEQAYEIYVLCIAAGEG